MVDFTSTNSAVASFKNSYKYKIAGTYDGMLGGIGGMMTDETAYSIFKTKRTRMLNEIKALETSQPDVNLRKKQQGEIRLEFLSEALRFVKNASLKGDQAKKVSLAVMNLAREVEKSAQEYTQGRTGLIGDGNDYSADDAAFFAKVKTMADGLNNIMSRQKVYLLRDNIFFDKSLNSAKKYLARSNDMIAAFQSALSSASSSSSSAMVGDGGVDITA